MQKQNTKHKKSDLQDSMNHICGELITEYLSNYLCFIALSVEVFSIMFVYGLIKSVVAVLLVDTIVLIGTLIVGIVKANLTYSSVLNKNQKR